MKITTQGHENYFLIAIDGELDASSSILLDKELEAVVDRKEPVVLVDCEHLSYISSAGLGVFMSYLQDFKENDMRLALFQVSEKVRGVFAVLGLDKLVTLVGSRADALAAVQ